MTAPIEPRVFDECMVCFEDGGNGVPRTYCACCGKPMCGVCKAAYFSQLASGVGCPSCRSTGGALFVTIDVQRDGPMIFMAARSRVTLRMDGAKSHLDISERAARFIRRKNGAVVNATRAAFEDGLVSLQAHRETLRKMVGNVCDAVLGNLESDATVESRFRQSVRDGRVKCTFRMFSDVDETSQRGLRTL